jgi:long-chain fatty acid transport protein
VDFSYVGPDDPTLKGIFETLFIDGTVSGVVTLPESITAGVAFDLSEKTSIEIGGVWTRWSRYKSLDLEMPGLLGTVVNPKNWKDTWRVTFGVEHSPTDWLDLRIGYNWTQSPMTTPNSDYTVPTNDRHTFTFGFGLHNERYSLDLAYLYVYCQPRHFDPSPAAAGGNGRVLSKSRQFLAHEGALSFTYHF